MSDAGSAASSKRPSSGRRASSLRSKSSKAETVRSSLRSSAGGEPESAQNGVIEPPPSAATGSVGGGTSTKGSDKTSKGSDKTSKGKGRRSRSSSGSDIIIKSAPVPKKTLAVIRAESEHPKSNLAVALPHAKGEKLTKQNIFSTKIHRDISHIEDVGRVSLQSIEADMEEEIGGEDWLDDDDYAAAVEALEDAESHPGGGGILSKNYKNKEKRVKMFEDEEESGELSSSMVTSSEKDTTTSSEKSRMGLRAGTTMAVINEKTLNSRFDAAEEAYDAIRIRTLEDLLESRARRAKRLDAYCLGRGVLNPAIEIQEPEFSDKVTVQEENLQGYPEFMNRIQELEDVNVDLKQIVCIFTANYVSHHKTWSEDCNAIEAAISFLLQFLEVDSHILWVRVGSHKQWHSAHNPFKLDKHLSIKSIPTVLVWGTEKRLASSRLFNMDYLSVLLED